MPTGETTDLLPAVGDDTYKPSPVLFVPLDAKTLECFYCGSEIDEADARDDTTESGARVKICQFCFGTTIGHSIKHAKDQNTVLMLSALAQSQNLILRIIHEKPINKFKHT
jgi:hypothetical protein